MARKKQDWKPATSFTVKKLKANGPKNGQSTENWMKGKQLEENKFQQRIQHDSSDPRPS
jgi:hypothetical protein